jgi:anaerobic selenocysteine-containing dehydrogenase
MPPTRLHTTCPLDCPDACSLEVSVSDGRITEIAGTSLNPVTNGFICSKVRGFDRRVHGELRLLSPLRRVGRKGAGDFAPITWDDAIGEIVSRFREIRERWGGEAILPYHYGGSNGVLTDGYLDDLFFARLGASRLVKTLCAVPTTMVALGMYGKMPGVAFQDYVHAKCIIVWGANPKASNIHLVPYLRAARERGAFVAVVDPRRNFSANEADLHLPVLPGTDLPVALSMINLWRDWGSLDRSFLERHAVDLEPLLERAAAWPLERAAREADVEAGDIERVARVFAESTPAVMRCGWGVERNRNGGHAVAAILAMPALLGKFGVRGGGYTLSNNGAARLDRRAALGALEWTSRVVNMTKLGEVLTDGVEPPVKALVVYNCNPAATVPDQNAVLRGLARDDLFTVVFDQVMTDTAPYADIVLPATTFLEHIDLRVSYGSYGVGPVRPVVEPLGQSKSNLEVFALLGRAMGFADEAFQWDPVEAEQAALRALSMDGADPSHGSMWLEYDFPGTTPVMFETVHPLTADGKIHLVPSVLGPEPYAYRSLTDERYPLALVSPATSRTVNSSMGEYALPELYVEIHPADAADRSIANGDPVRVFNDLGAVACVARVAVGVRRGVVVIPKGAWRAASMNGQTATAVCPPTVSEVGGGACYNEARVEVERAVRAP